MTERLTPDMLDVELLIDEIDVLSVEETTPFLQERGQYLVTVGTGDALPQAHPYPKIPWLEAMLGCPIKITEGQVWNEHYAGDPEQLLHRRLNVEHNGWYQLYLEFLKKLGARLGGASFLRRMGFGHERPGGRHPGCSGSLYRMDRSTDVHGAHAASLHGRTAHSHRGRAQGR